MKQICMALLAIVILSCNKAENKTAVQNLEIADEQELDSTADTTRFKLANTSPVLQAGSPEWDRKIIKTATLHLELKDYNSFNNTVHQSIRTYGAYVANEQQYQSEGQISNNVTIKVPVDQFDNLMNFLSSADKNIKVLDRQVSTEDVSTQVVDTKSRIETKKKLRDKYFELMSQSKKMDDVIRVQNEISAITEDIEAASSRVQYLSQQSAYSTINLKYYQILDAAKVDNSAPGFFTSLSEAFRRGASIIIQLLLLLVSIWPLLIAGLIGWYLIKRRMPKPKPQQVS